MNSPMLAELPPAPPEKTGWPWTVETPALPPARPDGSSWPRISIVTPSYNQGRFIEETIRSVLLQGYPDLEYIIIDGGSTDQSVGIIKKYEPWLTYWVSEKDHGAPDAINRGLEQSTGSICAWLNSDDIYCEGTLASVVAEFSANEEADVISGISRIFWSNGEQLYIGPSPLRTLEDFCRISSNWTKQRLILQPEAFFRPKLYREAGPLRTDLRCCYDVMLWIEAAARGATFVSAERHWADFRMHNGQKTADLDAAYQELARSVFSFCRDKANMDRTQFAVICSEVVELLDAIADRERERARRFRESTSYKIGHSLARLRFW